MSDVFTANPLKGMKPLEVTVTNNGYDVSTSLIAYLASGGYLYNTNLALLSSGGQTGIPEPTPSYSWDFDDGDSFVGETPLPHTYKSAGYYTLTCTVEVDYGFYIDTQEYAETIKVLDKFIPNLGSGFDKDKQAIRYGNTSSQGWSWSTEGGEKYAWADTQGALLGFFDKNKDWIDLVFDSKDGLPYCLNPKKTYKGSNIIESFLDKYEPYKDKGEEIKSTVRLPELKGREENYYIQLSDLNLFYNPYRKGEGFRDNFAVNLKLYNDFKLLKSAKVSKIPEGREIYFKGEREQANAFNLEFLTETSYWRLRNCEIKYISYDKARFPFKDSVEEAEPQDKLSDVALWITRNNYGNQIVDRGQGKYYKLENGGSSVQKESPDGLNEGVSVAEALSIGSEKGLSSVEAFMYWVDGENEEIFTCSGSDGTPISFNELDIATYKTIEVNDKTWYLRYGYFPTTGVEDFALKNNSSAIFFDLRLLNQNIVEEDVEYYFNDIVNNNGNIVCPLTV